MHAFPHACISASNAFDVQTVRQSDGYWWAGRKVEKRKEPIKVVAKMSRLGVRNFGEYCLLHCYDEE